MANEITAEMLAAKATEISGGLNYQPHATQFLTLTRAHASLRAEQAKPMIRDKTDDWDMRHPPKDTPERVRCWYNATHDIFTSDENDVRDWLENENTITEGYFTAKGSTDD